MPTDGMKELVKLPAKENCATYGEESIDAGR